MRRISHDQRAGPQPEEPPEEYVRAVTRSSYPSPPQLYPNTTPASVVPSRLMQPPESPSLLERWAAHASNSQFNALSGAIGGFTSGIITCPLDVIKTKLQAQGGLMPVSKGRHVGHHKIYEGLVGTASVIWRQEGIRGMYRGLGPIILGYLPTWAVWFTVYNKSKVAMSDYTSNTIAINFWSSILAGGSSTVVTNPIWVIKTRLMSQSAHPPKFHRAVTDFPRTGNTPTARPTVHQSHLHENYKSTFDAARKMYSHEGILSFYSGLSPALLGLSHVAVQFPTYEYLKTKFTGQGMGADLAGEKQPRQQFVGILSASIISKIMASSATYPHEVIRTRLQTQRRPIPGSEFLLGMGVTPNGDGIAASNAAPASPKYQGVVRTFRTILHEEGWRAFYAGMGTNMMRAVPAATVTMLTYEYVMLKLNKLKHEGERKSGRGNAEAHAL